MPTPTPTPDHRFEDRLLAELRQVVAERPAPAGHAAPRDHAAAPQARRMPSARFGRRGVIAGTGVAGAVAAALVIAGGGSPAYAVESSGDGNVTVEISSVKDAAGLQAKLIAAGIPAQVDYLPAGKACKAGRFQIAPGTPMSGTASVRKDGDGGPTITGPTKFTFSRDQLKAGQTLVLTNSLGANVSATETAIAAGPIGDCEIVDAPKALEPPKGQPETSASPVGGSTSSGASTDGPATDALPALPPATDKDGKPVDNKPTLITRHDGAESGSTDVAPGPPVSLSGGVPTADAK